MNTIEHEKVKASAANWQQLESEALAVGDFIKAKIYSEYAAADLAYLSVLSWADDVPDIPYVRFNNGVPEQMMPTNKGQMVARGYYDVYIHKKQAPLPQAPDPNTNDIKAVPKGKVRSRRI